MRKLILTLAAVIALMTALAIPAAGQRTPVTGATAAALKGNSVDVTIQEMSISATSITRAGPVTFTVTNTGTITHELVVIKTDLAEDQLPAGEEAGKVSEDGSAGESGDLAPGATSVFTLTLGAGHYVLICNEPGHYAAGMHTTLAVASYVFVALKEMTIAADQTSVPAGPVTFNVTNVGTVQHEVVVIRTDLAPDKLPAGDEAGKVSETGSAGESGDVDAGTSVEFTLTLAPGRYLLICNEPGHYAGGMHTAFTVTGTAPAPAATAPGQTSSVLIAVREMTITADRTSVPAGTVNFEVVNIGTVTHEVVVIRTDLAADRLPAGDEAGKVSEKGSAGESGDVDAGQFATFSLTLAPGAYVLICNEPGHYAAGMRIAFTVK